MNGTEKLEAILRLAWRQFNAIDGTPQCEWGKGERALLLNALREWTERAEHRRAKLNKSRAAKRGWTLHVCTGCAGKGRWPDGPSYAVKQRFCRRCGATGTMILDHKTNLIEPKLTP